MADDNVQHGIDDNPNNDAEKGATLGGLGGAVVGAAAGSAVGPVGTAVGAVVGGLTGAGASGAAVSAVDKMDNDNTVTGVGQGATPDVGTTASNAAYNTRNAAAGTVSAVEADLPGNRVPGVQTGGHATDGTPDTRGITEKAADAITGDHIDDKTGKTV
ncbi:MAG: hypothetical protein JO316_19420 [Abitibacteriaceae bacterium]|nr:hypothetical protein [Abditibacteriaceae bacterium]MBV9867527.1 hypothetical protein [Abditibacteriaceae bacterium]